jgi:hypothetical protein
MSLNKKVLIYGRSLNLEGIGVSLKLEGNLDVVVVEADEQNCLQDNNPEVILFDLADPPKELNLALLRKQPGLLLIGVDPCRDEVLVLTGQRNKIVSACELAELVSAQEVQPITTEEVEGLDQGGTFGFPI